MAITRIHIGFPKTGSTFLQQYLNAHPNVVYSYDELDDYKRTGMLDIRQRAILDGQVRVISGEQLSLWAGGLIEEDPESDRLNYDGKKQQKYVAETLMHSAPNAKVLIVLRSPRSLLVSVYSQYISKGGSEEFEPFLNRLGVKICRLYDYQYTIELYQSLFGSENVLVLPFELLDTDTSQFLSVIEEFFELEHFDFNRSKINRSIPVEFLSTFRMTSKVLTKVSKILPIQNQLFENYLKILRVAKEKWFQGFESNGNLSFANEIALNRCIENNYRFYTGLKDHKHVLPFLEYYEQKCS
ncbi:MAG: sulfotransferase [Flavobacteriales bacterium]|nr:sulfotransferase [Flavobacteriales bacterium]